MDTQLQEEIKLIKRTFPHLECLKVLENYLQLEEGLPEKRKSWVEEGRWCGSGSDNICRYLHLVENNNSPKSRCNTCSDLETKRYHTLDSADNAHNQAIDDCRLAYTKKLMSGGLEDVIRKSNLYADVDEFHFPDSVEQLAEEVRTYLTNHSEEEK